MKNRNIIIVLAVLLMLSIGNYMRISSAGTVRGVDFVSAFAIGLLTGLLIMRITEQYRKK